MHRPIEAGPTDLEHAIGGGKGHRLAGRAPGCDRFTGALHTAAGLLSPDAELGASHPGSEQDGYEDACGTTGYAALRRMGPWALDWAPHRAFDAPKRFSASARDSVAVVLLGSEEQHGGPGIGRRATVILALPIARPNRRGWALDPDDLCGASAGPLLQRAAVTPASGRYRGGRRPRRPAFRPGLG